VDAEVVRELGNRLIEVIRQARQHRLAVAQLGAQLGDVGDVADSSRKRRLLPWRALIYSDDFNARLIQEGCGEQADFAEPKY